MFFDFGFSKEFFLGREVDFFFFEGGLIKSEKAIAKK